MTAAQPFDETPPRPVEAGHAPAKSARAPRKPPTSRRGRKPPPRATVRGPGELVAAVPALLGFVPRRSLVVVGMRGPRLGGLGAAMRVDLLHRADADGGTSAAGGANNGDTHPMDPVLDRMAQAWQRNWTPGVVVLLVEPDGHPAAQREVVSRLAAVLGEGGTRVVDALSLPEIAAGAPWTSLLRPGKAGAVADPFASVVAAGAVYSGKVIRADRAEYDELLRPRPAWQRAHVAAEMDAQRLGALLDRNAKGLRPVRREVDHVLARMRAFGGEGPLVGPELARLGLALGDKRVRDVLIGFALTVESDVAERFCLHLARELPDPARAVAATLVGYTAYARGEGALASAALHSALDSDPDNELADLLLHALEHGMPPSGVRELAELGREVADRLGLTLPPDRGEPQWPAAPGRLRPR